MKIIKMDYSRYSIIHTLCMIYLVCNIGYKCMPTQGVKLGHINSLLSEIQMLESVCLQPLQQTNIRVSGPKKVNRESNLKRCINFSIFIKTNLFWRMLHGNGRSLNISAWNCRREGSLTKTMKPQKNFSRLNNTLKNINYTLSV